MGGSSSGGQSFAPPGGGIGGVSGQTYNMVDAYGKPVAKSGGDEAGMTDPTAPMPSPTAPAGGTTVQPGGINIPMPGNYLGTPFHQSYGGQPAPYADLHAQIRDAFNNYSTGAGRFGNNMAARYSFQGGNAPWRPDANTPRQPIPQYGYNPAPPLQAPPPVSAGPGGGAPPPTLQPPGQGIPKPMPKAGGVDHAANFAQLMSSGDMNMAAGYGNYGTARDWFNKNQNQLSSQYGADKMQSLLGIRGGNRFLNNDQETQLMRMAGLGV